MTTSLGAICTDFYVNQKVGLKLDLPTSRETILHLFDRIRRDLPQMERFLRYEEELALESPDAEAHYHWLALGKTAIRSGWVNPASLPEAYHLHRTILDLAPYYLSISPLDVEFVELLFGFDIETHRSAQEVVFDALIDGSPLGGVVETGREPVIEVQPVIGFALTRSANVRAYVEVKTRPEHRDGDRPEREPISVYLTVRRTAPFESIDDFSSVFGVLAGHAERLAEDRVIPNVVAPLREMAG